MSAVAAITRLESAQLLRPLAEEEHTYLFKHALIQDSAYFSLLKHERKRLHEAVAETIRETFPGQVDENAARLAEHYWLAEQWDRAAEYSLRAGNRALRVYALREAMGHFDRALEALGLAPAPAPLDWYEALVGWAEAAAKFRPYPEQLEHLSRAEKIARDLNDKPRLARALYRIGGVHTAQGHNLRAGEPLAECFLLARELGDERLTIIPTYFMGMATLDNDPRGAIPLFERAIELAQRYEDWDREAVAWTVKAWAHARLGEFTNAHTAIERGQALLPEVKSPMVASDVDLFTGWAWLEAGDAERGLFYGQRGLDKARAASNFDCVCGAYLCVGFNQLTTRQLSSAQDAFQEAIRESQFSGATMFENIGRAGLAMARVYSGRTEAVTDLEQAHSVASATQDAWGSALIAQALGEMYGEHGDVERAAKFLKDALEFFRRSRMVPSLVRTLDALAQVYAQQGRASEAQAARAEYLEWNHVLAEEMDKPALENKGVAA